MPTCLLPSSRNRASSSWVTSFKEPKRRGLAPEIARSSEARDRQQSKKSLGMLHQDMDREQMKLAILKQEQTFRQQVHELHRLYHVQRQLMQEMQPTTPSCAAAIVDVKPRPEFQIMHSEKPINPQQLFSYSSSKASAPAPAPSEDCSLELTLATGPSSSSSSSGNARSQPGKRLKSSSNSDSGTTAVSSTSTESELALFGEVDVTKTTIRFQSEARRMDEMGQGAWMYHSLSLKTA